MQVGGSPAAAAQVLELMSEFGLARILLMGAVHQTKFTGDPP